MTQTIKTAVEIKQELIDRIKSKGYISHIQDKYGIDLSKVEKLQDIIIEEIYLGVIQNKQKFEATSN